MDVTIQSHFKSPFHLTLFSMYRNLTPTRMVSFLIKNSGKQWKLKRSTRSKFHHIWPLPRHAVSLLNTTECQLRLIYLSSSLALEDWLVTHFVLHAHTHALPSVVSDIPDHFICIYSEFPESNICFLIQPEVIMSCLYQTKPVLRKRVQFYFVPFDFILYSFPWYCKEVLVLMSFSIDSYKLSWLNNKGRNTQLNVWDLPRYTWSCSDNYQSVEIIGMTFIPLPKLE